MGILQWAEQCIWEQRRERDGSYCATASLPGALLLQDGPPWIPRWTTSPRVVTACPSLRLCSLCWDTSTRKHLGGKSADMCPVKTRHCPLAVTVNKAEKSQKVSLHVASASLHWSPACSITHALNPNIPSVFSLQSCSLRG